MTMINILQSLGVGINPAELAQFAIISAIGIVALILSSLDILKGRKGKVK